MAEDEASAEVGLAFAVPPDVDPQPASDPAPTAQANVVTINARRIPPPSHACIASLSSDGLEPGPPIRPHPLSKDSRQKRIFRALSEPFHRKAHHVGMSTLRTLAIAVSALIFLGVSAPAGASTPSIAVTDMAFTPSSLNVALGSGAEYVFHGTVAHTTTSNQGFWNSGPQTNGHTYSLYMGSAGTYAYHCALHPTMTGTIRVPATSVVTSKGVYVRWGVFPPPLPSSVHFVAGRSFAVQYHLLATGATWVTWTTNTTLLGSTFHPAVHGTYAIRVFSRSGGLHTAWSPNAIVHY